MDRKEKLEFQQSIENYFEEKRVYDMFDKLLREVVINKPNDPIDFLINRIKKPYSKRIFIMGYPGTNRKEIALSLAESFNYSCCSVGDCLTKEISKKLDNARKIESKLNVFSLVDDETVIDLMKKQLARFEKENESYIIEGFPRNRVQAMFLQSVGLLPDNVIVLTTSRKKAEERIKEKLNNSPNSEGVCKLSIDETDLNLQAVKEVFKGFFCEINTSEKRTSMVVDEIAKIMRYKNKTLSARRPPKVLLLGPPCSGKYEMAEIIAKKFNIIHVSISDLLNKEVKAQNDNSSAILNCMNNGDLVADKYVFKLLEDRLYASDCMVNGWILTGFPKTTSQLHYLDQINPAFKPSLVTILEHDFKTIEERSSMRRIDPMTGKLYFINSKEFALESPAVAHRLVFKTEDQPELFKKRFENWEKFSKQTVDMKYNLKRINGELEFDTLIETIVDALEFASE